MELVCPAGSLPALEAAVDNGADAVYIGFNDETNARNFSGLNFNDKNALRALERIRSRGRKLFVAINTYAQPRSFSRWQAAVDRAAGLNADAVILADIGLMGYAAEKYPAMPLHLSVQASATSVSALEFYRRQFHIRRAVLPRVLSLKQVQQLAAGTQVELEVFGFGSLCIMAEGRCHLSSYVTGESPNLNGVCSPAQAVEWRDGAQGLETRLNGVLIDRFAEGENAGYPTLCKGRFIVEGRRHHALEEPTSLNSMALLPELRAAGIRAIKLEGRQRSPAYVAQVVRTWRDAIDEVLRRGGDFSIEERWRATLAKNSEGKQTTLGAYDRPWQ
ncbi:U32 family peptidase [Microbulbifer thermotolerans]|uniref:Ubiquinone biosynthesis protein UbiU n=1 Tax=Microbulbifer thermotolerans TaxID=252514 RepID=A0AB35HYT7_MICTH|nr:peptidase U32 family protein [Microbulbifer thermotolerans]MCX2783993.1 U32 family peptidase [Microbulbifer thermotolerans]MCX2802707.1 U32 family peptidase [Microbulbifer thermotolerans]MCX2830448.1 U32 family peptidase [Microbulbifer thermotolerans]MCX2835770.1 U32 family peptidase [Microbulbifer thermotolerans]WKT61376.1 peptidase U32 family protein [Microbulbifer thermotolerans]